MKKKKIIITSIIILVLVLSLGLSYAVMNFNNFGRNNSQLVLGNIWMHYKENNQLIIDGNNEAAVKDITLYTVNSVMETQELNELGRCINYFNNALYGAEKIDVQEYCKGTGTINGMTLQEAWDDSYQQEGFMEEMGNELVDNNIMVLENDTYIVNPIMATQELNELGRCITFFSSGYFFDEGSTAESYCQGTGTRDGMTIQNDLDEVSLNESFLEEGGQQLLDEEIIVANKISYTRFKINPIMQEEESGTGVLGKCEEMFSSVSFDEGSTPTTLCQGTGTVNGVTLQETIDLGYQDEEFMESVGYQMLKEKIILPVLDLKYFEFTIDGKNTYTKKDIWYEIVLMHGDNHETRSERIKDEFLTFTLTEVIDGEEVQLFSNRSYKDLKNQRIWVDTIPANTVKDIEKTYRLYMNFIHNIRVGEVGPNSDKEIDYSFDTWNNEVYGSIKVKVTGDFLEKEVEYKIPERCFETEDIDDGNVVIVGYDKSCTKGLIIPNTINNKNVKIIAPNAFNDLEITSLKFEKNSNLEEIYENSFTNNLITSVSIPDSVTYLSCVAFDSNVTVNKRADLSCSLTPTDESCFAFESTNVTPNTNMTDEELATCVSLIRDKFQLEPPEGEDFESFCNGTGTLGGEKFVEVLSFGVFSEDELITLVQNNIVTFDVIITNYDASCGSDVVIPSEFQGFPVTVIGNKCSGIATQQIASKKFNNILNSDLTYKNSKSNVENMAAPGSCGSFGMKELTSVVIPNTVKIIEENAFEYNNLTNVIFQENSKLKTIKLNSFIQNNITSVDIPDSVTNLDCSAFDSNVKINKRDDLICSLTPTDASCFYTSLIENNGKTEVVITAYDASCGSDVIIPSEIDGYPVTIIGNNCSGIATQQIASKKFNNILNSDLTYKNSKSNVENMEAAVSCGALSMRELTSVIIPNTVRLIEDEAFNYNNLTQITIPNSVVEIGSKAFASNDYLTTVIFENNSKLETISNYAFSYTNLTSVDIPDSVTYLSCYAFDDGVTINKNESLVCAEDRK